MLAMATEETRSWAELSSQEKVGRRMKALRKAADLAQEHVAVALDMSMVKLQRIERGEATLNFPEELERACALFSVTFEQFMDPNYEIDPATLPPFVLLTVGRPSKELAARMENLVKDFNAEHVEQAKRSKAAREGSKPSSGRPAAPKSRASRPAKNE